jgi:hypothetical protein
MIHQFPDFLNEISGAEIHKIQTLGNKLFTIAFEIELETKAVDNISWTSYDLDEIEEFIQEDFLLESDEPTREFLREIIDQLREASPSEILRILKTNYETKGQREVINNLWNYLTNDQKDLKYLQQKIKKLLPNFYRKYYRFLIFETDSTLHRGLEIHPRTYFKGLKTAVDFLHDFYTEFNQQSYFEFNSRTSIHINIGLQENTPLNIIKGVVFLADLKKDDFQVPYVFQGMVERMNNNFCGSIKEALIPVLREIVRENPEPWDLVEIETKINEELKELFDTTREGAVLPFNSKNVGFNLAKIIEHNYVEFRYVGGQVSEETVLSKLYYFCWVVYIMSNDYQRPNYFKKLYKFLTSIK